jgi:5-methylcytosine-specific restriction endonuclease McrA
MVPARASRRRCGSEHSASRSNDRRRSIETALGVASFSVPYALTCRVCGAELPATPEFFYARRDSGKLRTDCKACFRAAKTARDVSDPEYRRAAARKSYHKAEPDGRKKGVVAKGRARESNPQLYAAIAERYETRHLAERKARRKERLAVDRDNQNAKSRAWYYANRERALATSRAWQDGHPEQHKANVVNVRTRRRGAPGAGFSGRAFAALVETYGGLCAYCSDPLGDDYEPDHVVALGRGRGGHNVIDNIVPACKPCNRAKSSKTVEMWLEILLREGLGANIHPLALPVLQANAPAAVWLRVLAARMVP